MKFIKKNIIYTVLIATLSLNLDNVAFASTPMIPNNYNTYYNLHTQLVETNNINNTNNANNNQSPTPENNTPATMNQGAQNAKELMSRLTAEIAALFNKYGNSGYPLLNKAVQVIKIVLTYVLRTIEDILVLIHDLLKVATS